LLNSDVVIASITVEYVMVRDKNAMKDDYTLSF